jgi:hypothetical protein
MGCGIIGERQKSSAHLRRPWRAKQNLQLGSNTEPDRFPEKLPLGSGWEVGAVAAASNRAPDLHARCSWTSRAPPSAASLHESLATRGRDSPRMTPGRPPVRVGRRAQKNRAAAHASAPPNMKSANLCPRVALIAPRSALPATALERNSILNCQPLWHLFRLLRYFSRLSLNTR